MSDLPRSRRVLALDDNHEIRADIRKLLAVPSDDLRVLEADLFGPSGDPVWE